MTLFNTLNNDLFVADLLSEAKSSVAIAAVTAKALREQLANLPSLLIRLAGLATHSQSTDASIRAVKVWLDEIKQRETQALPKERISHLSIIELSEREHELLGFLTQYGLQEYPELVQTLLYSGIVRRDLEELVCTTQDQSVLPELLDFVEVMLAAEAMAHGITSELVRVSALVDAVVTYTGIRGS